MSDIAIRVENLGKRYRIGRLQQRHDTLRDAIAAKLRWKRDAAGLFPDLRTHLPGHLSPVSGQNDFIWALKDVSFEVKRGEVVGIIGRNGAGKSTLLKVLSRITEPTEGWADIYGRVGTLLEVGTGFHPELTGRENIFLSGAILGMKRAEIERKFDEIVAFAEIEKFIDTPVKHFSSGMYVRLAFAVAAHLEPEILMVDEVLAVGDAAFQKKCLGKMGDVAKEGRTVLFVSHNMEAITRLCGRSMLLHAGFVNAVGYTDAVVRTYLREFLGTSAARNWIDSRKPGNEIVSLFEVRVHDSGGKVRENFEIAETIGVTMEYAVIRDGAILRPAFSFTNERGINIFDSHDTSQEWRRKPRIPGIYQATVWIPGNFLAEGVIIVGAAIVTPDPFKVHFNEKEVVSFNVADKMEENLVRGDYVGHFPGAVRPLLNWEWKVKSVSNAEIDS